MHIRIKRTIGPTNEDHNYELINIEIYLYKADYQSISTNP